jgi:hypothetical protein
MRRLTIGVTVALVPAVAAIVRAHPGGGLPASDAVRFHPESPNMVIATTFGLLFWDETSDRLDWVCPDAVGFSKGAEPDVEVAADGTMFVTARAGLVASRDGGCSWDPVGGALQGLFTEDVEVDASGRIWAATGSGGMSNAVFASEDGGLTFAPVTPALADVLWSSVRSAPSDPDRVYATGWRPALPRRCAPALDTAAPLHGPGAGSAPPAICAQPRRPLALRSSNGGASWEPVSIDTIDTGTSGDIRLLGVSPVDPDLVFLRADQPGESAVYRSEDGGATWSNVLSMAESVRAFVVRRDGTTAIAGTVYNGVRISTDGGITWDEPATQPEMACVAERSDGALFACGSNWDPDFFMLGRSQDAMQWEPLFRAIDIDGPLECPAGTPQHDVCAQLTWLTLCADLQLPPCAEPLTPDAGTSTTSPEPAPRGCGGCSHAGGMGLAFVLFPIGLRGRRRRRAC